MLLANVDSERPFCNRTDQCDVSYHVDTIGLWSPKWWPGSIDMARRTLADPIKDCQKRKCLYGTVWDFHHPTERTLLLFAHWQFQGRPISTHRVDIAEDKTIKDSDARAEYMQDAFDLVRLRRCPLRPTLAPRNELNFYINSSDRRVLCCYQRRRWLELPTRTIVVGSPIVRTELRFMCSEAVERAGLSDLHKLGSIDLKAVFDKYVRMQEPY